MTLQLDTSNSHDSNVIEKMNKMLSLYEGDVLELILTEWADDSDLSAIAEFLENRAIECGVKEMGDYPPKEPIKAFLRVDDVGFVGMWTEDGCIEPCFKSIRHAQTWGQKNGYIANEMEIEGIMIDDWCDKEADGNEGGFGWTQMCSEHAKGISERYQDDHGSGTCAVVGCCKESDHYINDLESIRYKKD
jgi:hypothetical protein